MYFITIIKYMKPSIVYMNVIYWNRCILYCLQYDISMHNCAALIIIIELKYETTRRIQKIIRLFYCMWNKDWYAVVITILMSQLFTPHNNVFTVYALAVVSTIWEICFVHLMKLNAKKIICINSFSSYMKFRKIGKHDIATI